MEYDFYNKKNIYRPKITQRLRDILYDKLFDGLGGVDSVCEIGVGFGELAHYCRLHGIEYLGVDMNENLLAEVSNLGFDTVQATIPPIPSLPREYDIVIASHFIEHLPVAEVMTFLVQCKAIVGKYLILLYPDVAECRWVFWHDYTHQFVPTQKSVENVVSDMDYEIIRSGHYTVCVFGFLGWMVSRLRYVSPVFLLPKKLRDLVRLSLLRHCYLIGKAK